MVSQLSYLHNGNPHTWKGGFEIETGPCSNRTWLYIQEPVSGGSDSDWDSSDADSSKAKQEEGDSALKFSDNDIHSKVGSTQ